MIFWNDGRISEICQKWIRDNGNYANTKFEELCTCSGEVLFTREHKASLSRKESGAYIDIDEFPMFKDFSNTNDIEIKTKTKTITEIETEKIMLNKLNKKIRGLKARNEKLAGLKAYLTAKIDMIYEGINELQDEIYSDDSWLRLVELDKIDAILEKVFNTVWTTHNKNKKRINSEKIMIDKDKDIDGYVCKHVWCNRQYHELYK